MPSDSCHDLNLAQESWKKEDDSWATFYRFRGIDIMEFRDMEIRSKELMMCLARDPSYKMGSYDGPLGLRSCTWIDKDLQFLHEVLQERGRIVMDIDLDGPMLKGLYNVFPPDSAMIPVGFMEAVEDLIFKVIYDLDKMKGKMMLRDSVSWCSHGLIGDASPYCWTQACRKGKVSFHLTIPIFLEDLPKGLKVFYMLVNEEAKKDWRFKWLKGASLMDMTLCHHRHQLRLPWQMKRKHTGCMDHVHKMVSKSHSWSHAISGWPGFHTPDIWRMNIAWDGCHPFLDLPVPGMDDVAYEGSISREEVEEMLSRTGIDLVERGYSGVESWPRIRSHHVGWRLRPSGPQDCPCCCRVHPHTKNAPIVCASRNRYFLYCFQEGSRTINIGVKDDEGDTMDLMREKGIGFATDRLYEAPTGPLNCKLYTAESSTVHVHDQNLRHNENIDKRSNLLMIRSAMGTGKSELAHDIMESQPEASILIISNRRVQAMDYHDKYGDLGFKLYDPEGTGWEDAPRLVVELESLRRVRSHSYDIVILDEIMALFSLFIGNTMEEKVEASWNKLQTYIQLSTQTLCLDATLSPDVVKIMSWMLKGRRQQLVINSFKPGERQPRTVYKYEKETEFNGHLMEDKRNLFIVTNDATWAIFMTKMLLSKGVNVLLQAGKDKRTRAETEGIPAAHVKDPDPDLWDKYQVVIITPTVLNGISYEKPYFHALYIHGIRSSCSCTDLLQMACRVRIYRDQDIHMHISRKLIPGSVLSIYPTELVRAIDDVGKAWATTERRDMMHLAAAWTHCTMDLKQILVMAKARLYASRRYMEEVMDYLVVAVMGWALDMGGNSVEVYRKDVKSISPTVIALSKECQERLESDKATFHLFIKKDWDRSEEVYNTLWCKGGDLKDNLVDICRMVKIDFLEQRIKALEFKVDDISYIDGINASKTLLQKYEGSLARSKLHCWKSFLHLGKAVLQDGKVHVRFDSAILKTKPWGDLMIKIGSCWTKHDRGLRGRQVWEAIARWLREGMLIQSVEKTIESRSGNIKIYLYTLDLREWIGKYAMK